MEQDTYTTDVIFRKEKDNTIVAIFPYLIYNKSGLVDCYAHLGQHSGCDYNHMVNTTKLANEAEYVDLKKELEDYGYKFRVIRKRHYDTYLTNLRSR